MAATTRDRRAVPKSLVEKLERHEQVGDYDWPTRQTWASLPNLHLTGSSPRCLGTYSVDKAQRRQATAATSRATKHSQVLMENANCRDVLVRSGQLKHPPIRTPGTTIFAAAFDAHFLSQGSAP